MQRHGATKVALQEKGPLTCTYSVVNFVHRTDGDSCQDLCRVSTADSTHRRVPSVCPLAPARETLPSLYPSRRGGSVRWSKAAAVSVAVIRFIFFVCSHHPTVFVCLQVCGEAKFADMKNA